MRTALQEIDRGFIGTTHAFCARLLRERPVEAGLDPEFEELDDAASKHTTAEFWNRWYEEQSFVGNALLAEARDVGLDRKTLRGAFEKVVEYPDVVLVSRRTDRPDLHGVCDTLGQLIEEVEPHLPTNANRDKPDDFEMMIVKLLQQRRSRDLDDPFEQFAFLDEGNHISRKATLKRWPDGATAKRLYTSYSAFAEARIRPAVQRWREHVHGIALDVLRPAAEAFAAERKQNGTLTFQDLLICARDMLRDHPVVRRYFQKRFTHLLVDEFQDTDPLQAEVLFYLTGEDVDEKNWQKLRPRPGSLFIVGDPKQSIYRFRRADITTYLGVKKRIEESGGEILKLSTSFRSGPTICSFVNGAFGSLFTKTEVDAGRQAPHVDLTSFHTDRPANVYRLETPDDYPNAAVQAEAETIGRWILRSVSAEPSTPAAPGSLSPASSLSSVTSSLSSRASSEGSGGLGGIRDPSPPASISQTPSLSKHTSESRSTPARNHDQLHLFQAPEGPQQVAPGKAQSTAARGSQPPNQSAGATVASDTAQPISQLSTATGVTAEGEDERPLRYSDILLISWYRPRLSYYARAFERLGIPYEITGSRAFKDLGELESTMPLLRATVDPDDEVSIVAFLRGPFNGADDDALYQFVRAGGKFSPFARELPDGTDERIATGLHVLRQAIKDAQHHPPAAAIARLFNRLGILPLAASAPERPGTRSGNLLLALNIARESSARGESLAAIVEQFNDLLTIENDIGELDVDPARANAVQLMNLHQVKGLEARVVFLIDPTDVYDRTIELHVDRSGDQSRGHFIIAKKWGQGKKVLATPPGWEDYEQEEKQFQSAEKLRLLYVAATRAQRMLIVGYRQTDKGIIKGPWRELASRASDPLPMPEEMAASPLAAPPPAARLFADAQAEIAARFDAARQASYSVLPITKIAHNNHAELVRAEEGLGKGMSWGRVLHRLFEAMLRDELIDIRLYAENLLKDEERDVVELTEVMRVVEAVQSSPLWQRVKSADERYVEIPFALEVPAAELGLGGPLDTLLHGTIDLVFREGSTWYIVDYKSDSTRGRIDALVSYYEGQVRHYAKFWSRLTNQETHGGLFFVDGIVEKWVT